MLSLNESSIAEPYGIRCFALASYQSQDCVPGHIIHQPALRVGLGKQLQIFLHGDPNLDH